MKSNITAVCISAKEESWRVPELQFYCHTTGHREFPHYPPVKTRERVQYLSLRRNEANRRAVELNPNTEHLLTIDSYYVNQTSEIRRLVREYSDYSLECVLGATNWFLDHSKFPSKVRYWDTWATPEMKSKSYNYYPKMKGLPLGWEKVRGCGGFAVYPRWLWEKRGYGIPEPFPQSGNEVNYLCEYPGISSFVTFNVKAWRETPPEIVRRSVLTRIRTTVGARTRLGLRASKSPHRDSESVTGHA